MAAATPSSTAAADGRVAARPQVVDETSTTAITTMAASAQPAAR